jgi:predicted S18 family serine protease
VVDLKSISSTLTASASKILKSTPSASNYAAYTREAHYAVKLLKSLNVSKYQSLCESNCDFITSAFKQASTSLELFYAHSIATACGCDAVKFSTKSFVVIDEDIEVSSWCYYVVSMLC